MRAGLSAAEAARRVGLTKQALSMDKVCRELTKQQREAKRKEEA
jgi:hypothetical protein